MKHRKKTGLILAVFLILCCGTAVLAEDQELEEGQRKAVIRVVSITGNELTYYELPEESEETQETQEIQETKEASEKTSDEAAPDSLDSDAAEAEEKTSGRMGRGELPEGTEPGQTGRGELPEGTEPGQMGRGELPEGTEPGQMGRGELSEGFDPTQAEEYSSENADQGREKSGRKSGTGENLPARGNTETKTVYLPVSVVVHTESGEEMTFSILEAGDELEVLMETTEEEEMIVEIWMRNTEDDA